MSSDKIARKTGEIIAEMQERRKMYLRFCFESIAMEFRKSNHLPPLLIEKIKSDLELLQESDDFGTLMHHAAHHCSGKIVKHLVELGGDIDSLNRQKSTPLMVALRAGQVYKLQCILNCNPNVLLMDDTGKNALQLLFELELYFTDSNIKAFVLQVKSRTSSVEELAETLIAAGGSMFHAATLGDIELLKCMLDRKIDINSTNRHSRTALHASAVLNDSKLAIWLINNGANVHAVSDHGDSAFLLFAYRKNKEAIEYFLKNGADPNYHHHYEGSILQNVFEDFETTTGENLVECSELLLRYGAIDLEFPANYLGLAHIDYRHVWELSGIQYFVEYLAILIILGAPIIKSIDYFIKSVNNHSQLKKYYESCQRILEKPFIQKLSLLDLLAKCNLRQMVRNKSFVREIEKLCSEQNFSESYPYYYKTLMKRLTQANHMVKLENEAIAVIPKIFSGDYNSCYDFARNIVGYLDQCDLESLIKFETNLSI